MVSEVKVMNPSKKEKYKNKRLHSKSQKAGKIKDNPTKVYCLFLVKHFEQFINISASYCMLNTFK